MHIIENKILLMARPDLKADIRTSLEGISDLAILETDSERDAFKMIFNHRFVVIIADETLPHVDIFKIGTMLLSHKNTYNAPLLVLTDTLEPDKFLKTFHHLQIDFLQKPFSRLLFLSKMKIFFELFEQKNAVNQSIEELDKVYHKIIHQHELDKEQEDSKKELISVLSAASNQMRQPLQNLQGRIYQLYHARKLPKPIKSSIASMKTATERISLLTKKLASQPYKINQSITRKKFHFTTGKLCRILYVESQDEDFNIFQRSAATLLKCELIQARTTTQAMAYIADIPFNLIFISRQLPDGDGIDLISRLGRLYLEVPIIFCVGKSYIQTGPKAISKGASAFLVKENISAKNILSLIDNTLRKAAITKQVADARSAITLISQKDYLTQLYNRSCFESQIQSEMKKAKRYRTPFSILIFDFDHFKEVNRKFGYSTGDVVLTSSAALMQSMVRDSDMVCRYGGEEFGIILPHTDAVGAKILARRIQNVIAAHPFENESRTVHLTVSFGIASYDTDQDTSFNTLIKKALDNVTS